MSGIELNSITKCYKKNEKPAVDGINISVEDKECVVLVGPSGSGKTTILRIIAGLTEVSSGSLFIDGKDATGVPPRDRGIGMVFQNYALYPHMTVYENIAFGLNVKNGEKQKISEKVQKTASMLEIEDYLERRPGELSGGQRQRVAIGRAIVREPRVLLMDEPLSNLDTRLRNQMRAELIALRERIDATCIYVTHDQAEAMTLGDRIVVLNQGQVQQSGTAREIYGKPDNLFVAGFMGNPPMNFFENACLKKRNGQNEVSFLGKTFPLVSNDRLVFKEKDKIQGEIIAGIRPEAILLCGKEADKAIDGVVEFSEWLGSETILHVKSGENRLIIRTLRKEIFSKGSSIVFCIEPKTIHIFQKNGKRRL